MSNEYQNSLFTTFEFEEAVHVICKAASFNLLWEMAWLMIWRMIIQMAKTANLLCNKDSDGMVCLLMVSKFVTAKQVVT